MPNYNPTPDTFKVNDAKNALQISNVEDKVEKLVAAGVPLSKIVFGVHFSGFGFTKTPDADDEDATFEKLYRYNDIDLITVRKWKKTYNDANVNILTNTNKNGIIVTETTRSLANKVRFAVKRGLAGVSPIYAQFDEFFGLGKIEQDTFEDFKSNGIVFKVRKPKNRKYPLLRTINQAFDLTFEENVQKADIIERQAEEKDNSDEDTDYDSDEITEAATEQQSTKRSTTSTTTEMSTTTLNPNLRHNPSEKVVVCSLLTQSQLTVYDIAFDIDKVNWNLCTHVITGDDSGDEGMLFDFFWEFSQSISSFFTKC